MTDDRQFIEEAFLKCPECRKNTKIVKVISSFELAPDIKGMKLITQCKNEECEMFWRYIAVASELTPEEVEEE